MLLFYNYTPFPLDFHPTKHSNSKKQISPKSFPLLNETYRYIAKNLEQNLERQPNGDYLMVTTSYSRYFGWYSKKQGTMRFFGDKQVNSTAVYSSQIIQQKLIPTHGKKPQMGM